jgi:hypothetical protein
MNKDHAELLSNLEHCWCLGGHGSLKVAHISFPLFFYYLIASSGIKARVPLFNKKLLNL